MSDVTSFLPDQDASDGSATGGTASSVSTLVGGIYNPTLPTLLSGQQASFQLDVNGRLILAPLTVNTTQGWGTLATYSAAATFTVASSPTDVFTITGSATKTVRILSVEISSTETTASNITYSLILRSTANSGGTSTTLVVGEHDSNNAAATAVVRSYTANPTLGTTNATIRNCKWVPCTPGTAGGSFVQRWDFTESPAQNIVLRGTSQVLAVNLNGLTQSGNSYCISVTWVEDNS
jgi:hypothetical protein